MSSLSFGVLSRTSFEQILNNLFTSPPDQLPLPPPSEAPLGLSLPRPPVLVNPESNPPPLLETTHRERCKATTLESSQCRNWAKSTLSYCYTHRGLSSTKNSDCPICLEKFSEPTEIFLPASTRILLFGPSSAVEISGKSNPPRLCGGELFARQRVADETKYHY